MRAALLTALVAAACSSTDLEPGEYRLSATVSYGLGGRYSLELEPGGSFTGRIAGRTRGCEGRLSAAQMDELTAVLEDTDVAHWPPSSWDSEHVALDGGSFSLSLESAELAIMRAYAPPGQDPDVRTAIDHIEALLDALGAAGACTLCPQLAPGACSIDWSGPDLCRNGEVFICGPDSVGLVVSCDSASFECRAGGSWAPR